MAKNLNTKVVVNTTSAEKSLERLAKKITSVQNAVNNTASRTTNLTKQIEQTVKKANQLHIANQKVAKSAKQIHDNYSKSSGVVGALTKKLKGLAATYLGVMGMQAVITTSDTITSAENRLNNLNGGDTGATQLSMDKMYASSQESRMDYTDMMKNVSKSMTLAPDAFQGNIDNAIRFQEIMAKTYTLGGASAAEMSSSMYQLIQGLGSGILQGDELRSVREGAPLAYKAIEEFAQGIYGADENLKDLASQGKITSEIVVAAMMEAGLGIDEAFANTDMTFAQAFSNIKNTAVKSFEPVLQMLNDGLNSDAGQAIISGIGTAIQFVAGVVGLLFNLISGIYNFVVNNSKIIISILIMIGAVVAAVMFPKFIAWLSYLGFLILYYTYVAATAIASAMATAAAWLAANWPLLLIILIIAAIVVALIWLSDSFADACGMIVGVIMSAVAFVWNLIVGVINGIIQFLWTKFVEPWIGIIEWVLNVFNGGFDSFGDGVKNLLGQIISWFLSLGKVVTKIIDAIFGTDWTGGLSSLQDNVLKWGKNENAITLDRNAPTVQSMSGGAVDRWAYGDAYDTGYKWGNAGGQWISDKVSGIGDSISGALNMGELPNSSVPDYNVDNGYTVPTNDELLKGVDDIADNTGSMADSMELTEEDLDYLRKIADMEWKKEFTSATVNIKMDNNIQSDADYEGFVTRLRDDVRDEILAVAEGVYA